MTGIPALVDHLFRREAGKMVATLARVLGMRNVDVAEDVVQDALLRALEVWTYHGVPDNPTAWLFQTARHRAVDILRRRKLFENAARKLSRQLESPAEAELRDDQLRMMFACVHPSVPAEGQVAVILKFLCGFGVSEIAQAFLISEAAVEKRLNRARQSMKRGGGRTPPGRKGLDAVHQALYLLFNEGYHGSHPERSVREDLCAEALRLGSLLTEHPATSTPATFALMGLMCLHAARLPSRIDDAGSLVLLEAQDRSKWIQALIEEGYGHLARSASDSAVTPLHLEAGIAALHVQARSFEETDWAAILKLYTVLYKVQPSPIVALNRAIALSRVEGPDAGLREIERIRKDGRLEGYLFLEATAAELHRQAGRADAARTHFDRAISLARNDDERQVLTAKRASIR